MTFHSVSQEESRRFVANALVTHPPAEDNVTKTTVKNIFKRKFNEASQINKKSYLKRHHPAVNYDVGQFPSNRLSTRGLRTVRSIGVGIQLRDGAALSVPNLGQPFLSQINGNIHMHVKIDMSHA